MLFYYLMLLHTIFCKLLLQHIITKISCFLGDIASLLVNIDRIVLFSVPSPLNLTCPLQYSRGATKFWWNDDGVVIVASAKQQFF